MLPALVDDVFDDADNADNDNGRGRQARLFRKRQYFELENFHERFRISREQAEWLMQRIGHFVEPPTQRSQALSVQDKTLIALRYFASGALYSVLSDANGPSASSVNRAIMAVTRAINAALFQETICFPQNMGRHVGPCRVITCVPRCASPGVLRREPGERHADGLRMRGRDAGPHHRTVRGREPVRGPEERPLDQRHVCVRAEPSLLRGVCPLARLCARCARVPQLRHCAALRRRMATVPGRSHAGRLGLHVCDVPTLRAKLVKLSGPASTCSRPSQIRRTQPNGATT